MEQTESQRAPSKKFLTLYLLVLAYFFLPYVWYPLGLNPEHWLIRYDREILLCSVVCLSWFSNIDLEIFHLDRLSIKLSLLAIFILLVIKIPTSGIFYAIIAGIVVITLILHFRNKWRLLISRSTRDAIFLLGLGAITGIVFSFLLFPDFIPNEYEFTYYFRFFVELAKAAVVEEILFRGLLWGLLRSYHITERWTLVLQALLFGVAHIYYQSIYMLLGAIAFGLVTGTLVKKTRSLAPSIIAHAIVNTLLILPS